MTCQVQTCEEPAAEEMDDQGETIRVCARHGERVRRHREIQAAIAKEKL